MGALKGSPKISSVRCPKRIAREIFVLKVRPSCVKAQTPRVEASQGVYCPDFIQPNKQKIIVLPSDAESARQLVDSIP